MMSECVLRKRSRGWAYTVFNYGSDYQDILSSINSEYHVFAEESCPTTGNKHIQGYIYFKDVKTGSATIKTIGYEGVHVEPQGKYSSPKANRQYIVGPYNKNGKVKELNDKAIELGELPVQGTRKDLIAFKDAIKNGLTRREAYDEYANLMACYPKMFAELRAMYLEDLAWSRYEAGEKPEINVIYGPTGVGKTRGIFEKYGRNVYKLEIGDGSSGSTFWNGYDGQDVILIDDFYGQLKLDYLLRILDRYPQQFNTKGGYTWRTATKIFITSNDKPENWYKGVKNEEVKSALYRRFDSVIDLFPKQEIIVSNDVPAYTEIVVKPKSVKPNPIKTIKIKNLVAEKYRHIARVPDLPVSTIDAYDRMIEELRNAD